MTGRNRYRVKYRHESPTDPDYLLGVGTWSANIYAHDIDDARHQILKNFPLKRPDGKMVYRVIISCRKIYY